jgi:hypothetical protein
LSSLSRPEQVVWFFRKILGIPVVSKEVLSQRTNDYQRWVESYARNHKIPIEWAGKGVRKVDYVLPALRRMEKRKAYGVYFLFKSMEQGRTFRISVPKYPTQDPNHRILAHQTSRFTHYYFYIRDEVLGPILIRVASFFPLLQQGIPGVQIGDTDQEILRFDSIIRDGLSPRIRHTTRAVIAWFREAG